MAPPTVDLIGVAPRHKDERHDGGCASMRPAHPHSKVHRAGGTLEANPAASSTGRLADWLEVGSVLRHSAASAPSQPYLSRSAQAWRTALSAGFMRASTRASIAVRTYPERRRSRDRTYHHGGRRFDFRW